MFSDPKGATPLRKWNLAMVVAIVALLLAQRFAGHIVAVNEKLEMLITVFGAGLGGGVIFQLWKGRGK